MFDKLRQLNQFREMQKAIKKETAEAEKDGVKVIMNGAFEIEEICLNESLSKKDQEKTLKECFNEAKEKIQKSLASKMSSFM